MTTVLITGGLSGIGEAVALAFAEDGARLLLCDRRVDRGPEVTDAVRAAGGDAVAFAADVRDPAALQRAADAAGPVDVLVACAGIADQSRVDTGDPSRWRAVVETNVLGAMHAARAVLPGMLTRGAGHIFIVASVSGRESYVGEPAYIASKWAQVGFAHALRKEVMDAGIRVSVVEPGIVDTPLTRDNPAVAHLLDATEPLSPHDVAAAIRFAYGLPPHVVLSELAIRPLRQRLPA
jgi:NADP-dependent 3-hydroxy acid dehydrogenase YdfG